MELKIMNLEQARFYLKNGVSPIRVEIGFNDRIVFVFTKEDTFYLYGKWIEHCHEFKQGQEQKAQDYKERYNHQFN